MDETTLKLDFMHKLSEADGETLTRIINRWINPDFWFRDTIRPFTDIDDLLLQITQATFIDMRNRLDMNKHPEDLAGQMD